MAHRRIGQERLGFAASRTSGSPLIEDGLVLWAPVLLNGFLRPALTPIAEPQRSHLAQILDDLLQQLLRKPLSPPAPLNPDTGKP